MNTEAAGIIKDRVTQEQYGRLNYATACEDCSHFDLDGECCTFGFPTKPHLKRNQLRDLETSGMMAFCRAIEID